MNFEYAHGDKLDVKFQVESSGLEVLTLNGREVSRRWCPIWPGDHRVTVLIGKEWVVIKLLGETIKENPRTYRWALSIDGRVVTNFTW
jgi:hypothetical protein